jgi:hypothetical protein
MLSTDSTLFVISARSAAHGVAVSAIDRAIDGGFLFPAASQWQRR